MEIMNLTRLNLFGGSFFGNLITALCFGVLTVQTSSYYHAFPNDGRPLKLVVPFQLACITQSLYWWLEFLTYQINTVCASVTVQTFFAYRVYSLSANLYIGVLVQALVLLQFVMIKECTWLIVLWLAIQAIADIVITTCMCLLLRRRRTGFQKTDSVINRMVLYTISTGLITSVLSCFLLVMFAKYAFHFSEITVGMPLGAFYSITMLANLHMRTTLRARLATPSPMELVSYSVKKRMRQNAGDRGSVRANAAHIVTFVISGE
ncbi:hypothetical protein BS47DRAFT_1356359 [Hydnum rufescens UP504]|uniref:DUF6534 domain-containing protein n=1 Tax=Hydnum rufescens UP504 TaxID=1448309 RepID=A0A9P6DM70_9AGAM|nr:hypothetical protein BS47DRAFT_1356359 [Hydnum rufescens UP504]